MFDSPFLNPAISVSCLVLLMGICIQSKKLTLGGALAAAVVGMAVMLGLGARGLFLLLSFFVLAVGATAHRKNEKSKLLGQSPEPPGRTAMQVLANGGLVGFMGFLAMLDPGRLPFYLLISAGSLASALADTLSSELGIVYGRRTYNILTLKRDARGTDGVVSIEGTLIGIFGAGIIACLYGGFSRQTLYVLGAGILGNLVDSLLGAWLERQGRLGNDAVNFLNTMAAGLLALVFWFIFE